MVDDTARLWVEHCYSTLKVARVQAMSQRSTHFGWMGRSRSGGDWPGWGGGAGGGARRGEGLALAGDTRVATRSESSPATLIRRLTRRGCYAVCQLEGRLFLTPPYFVFHQLEVNVVLRHREMSNADP